MRLARLSTEFDGVQLAQDCVLLRDAEERMKLIDDDKQTGVAQMLLTDMFSRLSCRGSK